MKLSNLCTHLTLFIWIRQVASLQKDQLNLKIANHAAKQTTGSSADVKQHAAEVTAKGVLTTTPEPEIKIVETLGRPAAVSKRQNAPLESSENFAEIAAAKAAERTAKEKAKHEAERIVKDKEAATKVLMRKTTMQEAKRQATTTARPPVAKAAVRQHLSTPSSAASANPADLSLQGYQAQDEDSDEDIDNIEKMETIHKTDAPPAEAPPATHQSRLLELAETDAGVRVFNSSTATAKKSRVKAITQQVGTFGIIGIVSFLLICCGGCIALVMFDGAKDERGFSREELNSLSGRRSVDLDYQVPAGLARNRAAGI